MSDYYNPSIITDEQIVNECVAGLHAPHTANQVFVWHVGDQVGGWHDQFWAWAQVQDCVPKLRGEPCPPGKFWIMDGLTIKFMELQTMGPGGTA